MRAGDLAEYAKKFKDPDEEVFVLRAQDKTASLHVLQWSTWADHLGVNLEKTNEAMACSLRMIKWAKKNPGKVRLPD